MQKALLYLTIALVGVGLMVLVSEYAEAPADTVYTDAASYNGELAQAIEAGDVPEVPSCAKTIEVVRAGERIDAIEFICEDGAMREGYVAFIREEYAWDIATVGDDRVKLARILEE
jgi:hypothetical protein